MLRTIRYLANVIAFGLLIISYYVIVGQLTPIRHSMVNGDTPDGLTCDFYNATIIARSHPPISWGCSIGDLFSEPFPTIAAIFAVGIALFIFRFNVPWIQTKFLPFLFGVFLLTASGGATVVRLMFLITGTANFLYGLWTLPLAALFFLIKFCLDRSPKHVPSISDAEKIRRHKADLFAHVEIAERIKEREKNRSM